MKNDFVFPILSLSLICFVMVAALALVNNMTFSIIEEAAYYRATQAMRSIIPQADEFTQIESDNLPAAVAAAYRTMNDTGLIFIIRTRGFGGEMLTMHGICPAGNFLGSSVLAHNETISFANRVFDIRDAYEARGQSLMDVDAITGATRTFHAYQDAIRYALEAFDVLRRGGQ